MGPDIGCTTFERDPDPHTSESDVAPLTPLGLYTKGTGKSLIVGEVWEEILGVGMGRYHRSF